MKRGIALLILFLGGISSASLLDPVFNSGPGTDAFVEQVLPLSDKMLICGIFGKYNDHPAPFIARLNENGTLDTNFHSTVNYWVRHMALQPDGKIVVGGAFDHVSSASRNLIARLNADGTLDPSFDPGAGFSEKVAPEDPNPPYVFWLAVQPDGKILATGSFAKFNGQTARGIARLNSDGSLDTTFQMGSGFDSWGRSVQVTPSGQILFTGWMTSYNGFSCNRMVLMNQDGTPDASFRPYFGDKTSIYSAAPLPDGKWIASGHTKNEQGLFSRKIIRLNADGTEDPSFVATSNDRTECVYIQPDGRILVSGWFWQIDNQYRARVARLNPDGTLDPNFFAEPDYFVWTIVPDNKGRILISGGFPHIDGVARFGIARLFDPDLPTPQADPAPVQLKDWKCGNGQFEVSIPTEKDRRYTLEFCDGLNNRNWIPLSTLNGTGAEMLLQDASATNGFRLYRVRAE